jgi:hypothetical protein
MAYRHWPSMHRKLHFRDVSQVDESEQTKHVTADPAISANLKIFCYRADMLPGCEVHWARMNRLLGYRKRQVAKMHFCIRPLRPRTLRRVGSRTHGCGWCVPWAWDGVRVGCLERLYTKTACPKFEVLALASFSSCAQSNV